MPHGDTAGCHTGTPLGASSVIVAGVPRGAARGPRLAPGMLPRSQPQNWGISAAPSCSVPRAPAEGRRPRVPSRVQIRREASGAGLALAQRKQPVNFHWCCSELISSLRDPRQRELPGARRNYLGLRQEGTGTPEGAGGGDPAFR